MDFTEAALSSATLRRADLRGARLAGALLSGADISGCRFSAGQVVALRSGNLYITSAVSASDLTVPYDLVQRAVA